MQTRMAIALTWPSMTQASARRLNSRGILIPWYRYRLWDTLNGSVQAHAETLSYTNESWNLPGLHTLEKLSFETIRAESSQLVSAIVEIGFTEYVWDCWVNHYDDYWWEELEQFELAQYYAVLGWNQSTWDTANSSIPESSDLYWNELSDEQRTAAREVCYTLELWDELSLDFWPALPESPDGATNGSKNPNASLPNQIVSQASTSKPSERIFIASMLALLVLVFVTLEI